MTNNVETIEVKLVVEQIQHLPGLPVLLGRIRSQSEYFVLGDFSSGVSGRYSYLGIRPREVVVFGQDGDDDPFRLLEAACNRYRLGGCEFPVPFVGGWVGYLSYDLGRYIERLPDGVVHDIGLPLLRFGFYDHLLVWDHDEEAGYLMALEYKGQTSKPAERLERLRRLCEGADGIANETTDKPGEVIDTPLVTSELIDRMVGNISRDDYIRKVERAIEYIRAGDIFEVNLSQRYSCPYDKDPSDLYGYLAAHNPAGYSALLVTGDHAVVSASPELFLSRRGNSIVTRPIKGTISRGRDAEQDRSNQKKLEHSEKDRAELNMIIDLERNDLGRICRYGSVKVLQERVIETHPTVFHAFATIAGQLWPETTTADILRATFPGGSISGAPKIRAMEIIDELEPTARSVYTGGIGWIGLGNDLDLNIAIRTIILSQRQAYVQVGGAVVADSTAEAEYDETIAKAAALVRAIWATKD